MQRIPEEELMDTDAQARAYAQADFDEPHDMFIELFKEAFPGEDITGQVLDLGCGPADISIRFARVFPQCRIDGVDGAEAMLAYGREAVASAGLADRIHLVHGRLPETTLPRQDYEAVICNSLLHHLHDPMVLWESVKRYAGRRAPVFIMDLMRPESREQAQWMMDEYLGDEPEILRQDFFNSLLAAYIVAEVQQQLQQAGLDHLTTRVVSDRHMTVAGWAGI